MANLICRFGDDVLLDQFDDVVYPSFFDAELRRDYSDTSYFFERVSLLRLAGPSNDPVLGIVGRFIKDTSLTRQQIYVRGRGLVKDKGTMQSSPSALFLLILNSHRLVYVKETTDGPNLQAFRSTLLAFLRAKHRETLRAKLAAIDEKGFSREKTKAAKDDVRDSFARPTLELVPLTSRESIETFIAKYDVLNQITISFSDTNDETDLDEFFSQMQEQKDKIGSSRTDLVHRSKDGLNLDSAIEQVTAATAQGNQAVRLSGRDEGGDLLVGNNEKFQLKKPIGDLSARPEAAAVEMYEAFAELVTQGLVNVPQFGSAVRQKVQRIFRGYFNG